MKAFSKFFSPGIILCLILASAFGAEKDRSPRPPLSKTTGTPVNTYLNINNISTVFWNNGYSDIDNQDANSGLVFPKGSRKTAIFKSGFLWGGIANGQLRVGGSAYRTGLQGGKILANGTAENPDLPKNRIYRVRLDYKLGDLSSELNDEGGSVDAIRARYEQDWNEWPWQDGAPYTQQGPAHSGYNPATDIPGVKGADQTIWYVANDLNVGNTTNLYGSVPIGLELQVTVWAYAQQGALGNMFFRKYLLINRSGGQIDSMYVSQWSDPDLGNASDDYAGSDTTLSLGYVYNANASDATYAPLPPPASGFDFFQGPAISTGNPADSAIFLGKKIGGKVNLPMTAFYYFANGDLNVTDPTQGDYQGTIQFYNFFQGKIGRTGQVFTDPNGVPTTKVLAGDPQARTGWVDGQILPAGDRRIGLASGPFTMAAGDTQEVVVAEICAGAIAGTDRLSCIGLLKFYDQQAQLAYDNFFDLPTPPPSPKVATAELNNEILLNWGSDVASVTSIENSNSKGFVFEGYNVYQLPSASATIDQAKRLATYDIIDGVGKIEDKFFDPTTGVVATKVTQFGNDVGIRRYLNIKNDALHGGTPLINGTRYYFAVTAYSYNGAQGAVPNNLESPPQVITVVPHSPNPGVRLPFASADTIPVVHSAGVSEGAVIPIVLDPSKLTGQSYKVNFDTTGGETSWSLTNTTTGTVIFTHQLNQAGDDNYFGVDGMLVKVTGPATPGMKDWSIPNGTRRFTFADADFGFEGFSGSIGWDDPAHYFGTTASQTVSASALTNVLIKLAAASSGTAVNPDAGGNPYGGWDENNPGADPNFSYGYRYLRSASAAPARPEFAPYIVNPAGGYAYQDYKRGVPVSAWNVEANPPVRLAVGFLENNRTTGLVDGKWWPPANGTGVTNNGDVRDWLFIFNRPYTDATPVAELQRDILGNGLPVMWWVGVNRRGGANFSAGDEFLILANHINTLNDVFTFTSPAPVFSTENAKADVSQVNVFPNPYYGVNSQELNKYQRFVTFTHLPNVATIRIFDLAGVMVRRIDKNSTGQFERWDLANDNGLPVGSGMYIAYIDMPDIGATKIVKLAVIQEQQVLDRF